MTRTIGIVVAIAACCLHLGAPTAAGTKTRGNGGSDPDIGHTDPRRAWCPRERVLFSIVAIAVALSAGTARAGSKVLATGPAAYAATLSQAGPLSFPTRVRVFALGAPRSVTAGFVAARPTPEPTGSRRAVGARQYCENSCTSTAHCVPAVTTTRQAWNACCLRQAIAQFLWSSHDSPPSS